jgi:hypothetical protein
MTRAPRATVVALLVGLVLVGCETTTVPSTAPSVAAPTPSAQGPSPSPSESPPPPAAFRWDSPPDGSTWSKRRISLAATTAAATAEGARVVFTADWPGTPRKEACVAETPAGGVWACDANLAALGAPNGSVRLRFDVERDGGIEEAPDGPRTIVYDPPPPTWRAARRVLPKGCAAPALAVDSAGTYHVAATCRDGIGYASGGATGRWTSTTFQEPKRREDSGPQLSIDGEQLTLGFTRRGPVSDAETCGPGVRFKDVGVYVRDRELPGGDWSVAEQVGRADDILDGLRTRDGVIHAAITDQDGRARYERVTPTSTQRVPLRRVGSEMSLRVGDDGLARIGYLDWKTGRIQVATVDGDDVTTTTVPAKGNLVNPLLVLGPGNQPHLVWTRDATAEAGCAVPDPAPADGTYYGTLEDGAWTIERVTKATGPVSFVLDPATGTVHVLVNGSPNTAGGGRLTYHERSPDGNWTSTAIRKPADGWIQLRRDEADGTLVVAFDDGDAVSVLTRR